MRVMIVGSGAREHALAWKISQSPLLSHLISAPGNPGIAEVAECHPVKSDDTAGLVALAQQHRIDLVVVGPEDPLAAGLVDRLEDAGILAFGPRADAARLESSKSFAKDLMVRYGIPTARYCVVETLEEARDKLRGWPLPVAIKADGLARGRGVTIAHTAEEAEDALRRCMVDRVFGAEGTTVVLEEFLEGEEFSFIGLSDGTRVLALEPAEDHKQLLDGDRGPNTGGMGCFSPVPAVSEGLAADVAANVLQRAVDMMAAEGCEFRGALFAGLMLTRTGPRVIEFNVRFGDPEAEVLFPRMKSDLLPLLHACASGSLPEAPLEWRDDSAVAVVLCSAGYPWAPESGRPIQGLASNEQDGLVVFHAGTGMREGQLVTAGGRVLVVTALGDGLEGARRRAYEAADTIRFEGLLRRNDIGRRHHTLD